MQGDKVITGSRHRERDGVRDVLSQMAPRTNPMTPSGARARLTPEGGTGAPRIPSS